MKVLGNVTGTPYGKKDVEQYVDDNFRPNTWMPTAEQVGALPKTGGTLTGWVKFGGTTIGHEWKTADGTLFQMRPYTAGNILQIVTKTTDGKTVSSFDVKNDGTVRIGKPTEFLENIGAAPSGYGYGGVLPQAGSANDPEATILEAHLNNRLAGMKNGEAKQIRWITYPFLDGKWRIGTLFRSSDTQAVLTGVAYDGAEVRKTYNNGTWGDFEWFNPPMALGVQYRTTERVTIDGVTKPVFALEFTTGEMTDGAMINFHAGDITIVRCEVRCRNHVLPYYGGGDLVGGEWSIWYDITGKTFEARMGSGYTSNNYTVRVWYAD